jgi:hypothetical protein
MVGHLTRWLHRSVRKCTFLSFVDTLTLIKRCAHYTPGEHGLSAVIQKCAFPDTVVRDTGTAGSKDDRHVKFS